MKDSFYTPPNLARALVRRIEKRKPRIIADFSAGNGELLRAAREKWPEAKFVATDISRQAIRYMRRQHPDWKLGTCDFLSTISRNRCDVLRRSLGRVDIVLLNPPFSCIGGTKHEAVLDGQTFGVSTAMAFLVTSLPYLNKNGAIYCILPNSTAYSERDCKLWTELTQNYDLKVLSKSSNKHFQECSPHIILASMNAKRCRCKSRRSRKIPIRAAIVSVVRGQTPMNTIEDKCSTRGLALVHSTNLQKNTIVGLKYKVAVNGSVLTGPAVLIPRVGTPRKDKICTILPGSNIALSDCVMAIKTRTAKDSRTLASAILENWAVFSSLYQGTGARYTTLRRIAGVFSQ